MSYFNLATGGGAGDEDRNPPENDTPSGSIYNPFLIYGTAVSLTTSTIALNATVFDLYYGTGGAGAPFNKGVVSILTGLAGINGGGGGGGVNGTVSGLPSSGGGIGGTGIVVVTSYG